MGILEQKDIGLSFTISGTYHNTEINESGNLTLKKLNEDSTGNPIYATEGTWISDVIDLGDKFADYGKLFVDGDSDDGNNYTLSTRTSLDLEEWSEWQPVALDGALLSKKEQYIQIKMTLHVGYETKEKVVKNVDFNENEFVEFGDVVKLKKIFEYDMTLDTTWLEEGSLHRKKITRDEWLRIDKLNVLIK